MLRAILLAVLGVILVGAAVAAAASWRSEIDPVAPPPAQSFDAALVQRGAELAAVGNCLLCHTTAGGEPYAGGFPVPTPFGTVHSTNITPDIDTGIGRWSLEAFIRSMREGVSRDGRHLYPAFPYTHYTKTTDEDLRAIYAYLMTREPVKATAPENDLIFPLGYRPLLAGWKWLFLDKGPDEPDDGQTERWNRGAYLVSSLGHCSSCHTPRNALGAEETQQRFGGGEGEGWYGPAIDARNPSPLPWTEEDLFEYLRNGRSPHHGFSLGPMRQVTHSLQDAAEDDVRSMALYLASLQASASDADVRAALADATALEFDVPITAPVGAQTMSQGATTDGREIFAGACAICHHKGGSYPGTRPVELALSSAVVVPDPRNLLHIILKGVQPAPGEAGAIMPGFAGALTDEQIIATARFVREHFSDEPEWADLDQALQAVREQEVSSWPN